MRRTRYHTWAQDADRRCCVGREMEESRWVERALRHSTCDRLIQAACCVTTRGVEAAKPSDDAWEAARAVLFLELERYRVRTGSVFGIALDSPRSKGKAVPWEGGRNDHTPSHGAQSTRPVKNAGVMMEAYLNR
jgi:hypothetical protein